MGNVLVQRCVPIAIRRGKGPLTNAAVARMISKFEATGCLDDRPRSGRPSTRRNAAETVEDEMETVAGSSMHGKVSARAVARRTGIPYTTVWLALRSTLRCYCTKSIGMMNFYLAIPRIEGHLRCGRFKRWRKMTIG
ncbi:RNA-directed DNA polymerase from mobile element jockey [Trichonephila clavipes]|nr:RNA-directed DNA polymerase from mobile element jockey [Trichonephila clavipes]